MLCSALQTQTHIHIHTPSHPGGHALSHSLTLSLTHSPRARAADGPAGPLSTHTRTPTHTHTHPHTTTHTLSPPSHTRYARLLGCPVQRSDTQGKGLQEIQGRGHRKVVAGVILVN